MQLKFQQMNIYKKKQITQKLIGCQKQNIARNLRLKLYIDRQAFWNSTFLQVLRYLETDQCCLTNIEFVINYKNEPGTDTGGLRREWFSLLFKDLFNPNYGLWRISANGLTVQPSPMAKLIPDYQLHFKIAGKLIGNAFYKNENIEVDFTRSFLKHILGKKIYIKDLEDIDPEISNNLLYILDECNSNEKFEQLDQNFTIFRNTFGYGEIIELCENGKNIKVTNENKKEYVKAIAQMEMTTNIKEQIEAFLEGFYSSVPKESLYFFNEIDFGQALAGIKIIDINNLKEATIYNGYASSDQMILWFWEILYEFNQELLGKFLFFLTGSFKPPFDEFNQTKITIRKLGKLNNLPQSHTCNRELDLPDYSTQEIMKKQIMLAILEGGEGYGFG